MTAKEFLGQEEYYSATSGDEDEDEIAHVMIQFAKYHVERALEAQGKFAKGIIINNCPVPSNTLLMSTYPLKNIK